MIKKSPEFQQVDAVGTPGPSSDQDDDIPF
jgi:hypothetical protein